MYRPPLQAPVFTGVFLWSAVGFVSARAVVSARSKLRHKSDQFVVLLRLIRVGLVPDQPDDWAWGPVSLGLNQMYARHRRHVAADKPTAQGSGVRCVGIGRIACRSVVGVLTDRHTENRIRERRRNTGSEGNGAGVCRDFGVPAMARSG